MPIEIKYMAKYFYRFLNSKPFKWVFPFLVVIYAVFSSLLEPPSKEPYKVLLSSLTFAIALGSLSLSASRASLDEERKKLFLSIGEIFIQGTVLFILAIVLLYVQINIFGGQITLSGSDAPRNHLMLFPAVLIRLFEVIIYWIGVLLALKGTRRLLAILL